MNSEQNGGTPYPLRYFTGDSERIVNMSGGANPLPHAYFNPAAATPVFRNPGDKCDYIDFFYHSNLARQQAREFMREDGVFTPTSASAAFDISGAVPKKQEGGGAVGAPFMIPQFGRNPNITGNQPMPLTDATTGFSYRFATPNCAQPFESMWGYNLPTFNPIIKNPMNNQHM